jgi:hypothetical protein
MSGFAQAITNSSGNMLIMGIDLSSLRTESTATKKDVWSFYSEECSPHTIVKGEKVYNYKPVLGDIMTGSFYRLGILAQEDGHGLRQRIFLRKGSTIKRMAIGKTEYLLQSYRIYQRPLEFDVSDKNPYRYPRFRT